MKRSPARGLTIRDFLALVDEAVRSRLGENRDGMHMRQRFGYVQYYHDDSTIHYEIWVQRKTTRIELGLHFEGPDRDRNYAIAAALADRASEVIAAIGPEYELEEWTPQWTRLHRTLPAPTLTPELAADIADEAIALITGMSPLLKTLSS